MSNRIAIGVSVTSADILTFNLTLKAKRIIENKLEFMAN